MTQSSSRFTVFSLFVAVMTLSAVPALAQGPIRIVSPHSGERVGTHENSTYWVRWRSPAIPGNAGFMVSYATSGGPVTICEAAPAARECEWINPWSLIPFTGTLVVEARDVNGVALATGESGSFSIVDDGVVPLWEMHLDIGDVGRSGNVRVTDNSKVVLRGAGAGIQGTADAFHGLESYAGTAGEDYNLRATLTHIDSTNPAAQVGMMVRSNDFDAGEVNYSMLATPGRGIVYQRRLNPDGPTFATILSRSSELPVTFEIMERSGYTVLNVMRRGAWRQVASLPSGPLNVYLVASSRDRRRFATGTFKNVSLNTNSVPAVRIVTPENGTDPAIFQGEPYTIQWEQQSSLPATVSYSINRGLTWTVVPGCASVTTSMCLWTNPGPATTEARIRVIVNDPADREAWAATYPFVIH